MRKIAAFTLMELLIGMIISSIVISFGYMSYRLIYEQFLNFKQIKRSIMETTQLHTTLGNDVHMAEIISSDGNKIILHNKNKAEVGYEFYSDYILRTQNELTDTFKITAKNIQQKFIFPENRMLLQQLSFDVLLLNEPEVFYFVKNYNAETLMNYNTFIKANP